MGQRKQNYILKDSSDQTLGNLVGQLSLNPVKSFKKFTGHENVLLLSPYLHFPPSGAHSPSTSFGSDPFEPFGRSLMRHHSQIRHVPYVPKVGLMRDHEELIRQAGGIIVLACATTPLQPSSGERLDDIGDQQSFVKDVGRSLSRLGTPSVLVLVGVNGLVDNKYYDATIVCERFDQLYDAAGVIFSD